MSKEGLFRKTGKFASATAGLSGALLPSLTVKADDFKVSEYEEINNAFNNHRLSYAYCVLRFDFVKNYILSEVTKEAVQNSVETINQLLGRGEQFDFTFGKSRIRYIFNFCKALTKITGMEQGYQWINIIKVFSNFKERNMTARETGSVEFGCDDFKKSKDALNFVKKTGLYRDFFNYLINRFKEPSMKQYAEGCESFFFEFEPKSPIDLGDKGKCIALSFNFYRDHPSLIIHCLWQGKGFVNGEGKVVAQPVLYSCEFKDPTSFEEMEGIVNTIKNEIEKNNVNLKIYDEDYLEEIKRVNRGGKDVDPIN